MTAPAFLPRLEALMERATKLNVTPCTYSEFIRVNGPAIAQLVRAAENHAHVDKCNNLYGGCDLLNALAALNAEEK